MFGLEKLLKRENIDPIEKKAKEIAQEIIKGYENRPVDQEPQNEYLESLGSTSDAKIQKLTESLKKDFNRIKPITDNLKSEIREGELSSFVSGSVNSDERGKWTAVISLDYRKGKEVVPDSGTSYNKPNLENEKLANDWLGIRIDAAKRIVESLESEV